ncbi:MAG: single-stranded-DNA-specific exonuclease RecJ, partial [Clostridiales bacterium]|nr:single-stranded-DNA-specific exonuclease RecJ [Clostridiales bacterium]
MTKTARWDIKETDANLELMAKTLGIGEITARVMANRGIRSRNTALAYLNANLSSLRDPFLICGMEAAVRLLVEAASRREKITIYG